MDVQEILPLSQQISDNQTEIQLQQITTLYQTLLDNVPGYVVCRNYKGEFLFVNEEFAALFDKKPAEVVGLTDAAYGATPEEIAFYLQADRKVMDSGMPLFIESEVVLRKDGTRGLFQVSKVPLYLPESTEKAVLIVALDITERKQIEAQRQIDLEVERNINVFSQSIFQQNHIDSLLWEVARNCIGSLKFTDVVVYLLDKSGNFLIQKAAYGNKNLKGEEIFNPLVIPVGKGIVGSVAQTGVAEIVSDTSLDSRYVLDNVSGQSEITVPILLNGKVIGVIDSESTEKNFYQEKHLRILTTIANLVANRIDLILAEEKAKEKDETFRFIAENTSDGILVIENQQLIYLSPACEKILGYGMEELKQQASYDILAFLHQEDLETFRQVFRAAVAVQKRDFSYDYRAKDKLGNETWREHNFNIIYDEAGLADKVIIVIRDITARKLQEIAGKRRQETLARHNYILTQISTTPFESYESHLHYIQNILEKAAQGLEVSRTSYWATTSTGITCVDLFEKEKQQHRINADIHTHDFPAYFKAIHKGLAIIANDAHNHPHTYEFSETYLSPLNINSMLDVSVRVGGELMGVLCMEHTQTYRKWTEEEVAFARAIADIISISVETDRRKKAEEKEKESQAKIKQLSLVAEKATNGVLIADASGRVVWANQAFLEMFEIEMKDLLHQRPSKLFKADIHEDMETIDRLNQVNFVMEKEVFTYRGKPKWIELNHTAVRDENDELIQQVEILTDITERKLAEQNLIEKQMQLQQILDVTSKQNERLQNFTHIVSHNIRSHSSNLSMLASFLREPSEDAEQKMFFEMLRKSTNKLAETVENLNEIITIQNNVNLPKTRLCIREEIEKTSQALNSILLANQVSVINEVSEEVTIYGLTPYIESILLNMMTNAIKYRSEERAAVIRFFARKEGFFWILSIQDNGLGIDLEKHGHKLFGMYKTFHKNADARGIGLFITKNQIEAMGGKIEVESQVGVGTTFNIYFYAND